MTDFNLSNNSDDIVDLTGQDRFKVETPATRFRRATDRKWAHQKYGVYFRSGVIRELELLAIGGFAPASTALGAAYKQGLYGVTIDLELAFNFFRAAAESGDLDATMWIALAHHYGEGTPTDPPQAFTWFQYAADFGEPGAAFMVGLYLEKGTAVPQDFEMAAVHFTRAAATGCTNSQFHLGRLFITGKVPKNPMMGIFWLTIAAANGDADAQDLRDRWQIFFPSQDILKAQRAAREWMATGGAKRLSH